MLSVRHIVLWCSRQNGFNRPSRWATAIRGHRRYRFFSLAYFWFEVHLQSGLESLHRLTPNTISANIPPYFPCLQKSLHMIDIMQSPAQFPRLCWVTDLQLK